MKINEPIGAGVWAPFLIRVTLGLYFILAGVGKLEVLAAFIEQVKGFGILNPNLSALYATLLPYAEIFIGALLVVGLWTTLMGLLASFLILSFILAFGFFPGGDYDIFNKDVILLAASLSLMYSGPGVYGCDNLRRLPTP